MFRSLTQKEKTTIIIYLLIMLGVIIFSRLYWIFGDDPIGLLLVFFFLVPVINFFTGLRLGVGSVWCWFPILAGLCSVVNYMCNSMMTIKLTPDSGTLWVFAVAFASAFAGTLLTRIVSLLEQLRKTGDRK